MRNQAGFYALEALREVRDPAAFVFPQDENPALSKARDEGRLAPGDRVGLGGISDFAVSAA